MSRRPGASRPQVSAAGPPPIRFDDDEKISTAKQPKGRPSPHVQASLPFAGMKTTSKSGKGGAPKVTRPRTRTARARSWLMRQAILFVSAYTLFSALFACSSKPFQFDFSPSDSRAVCRSLAQTKKHVGPVITPYIEAAHAKIDPYTGPYIRAASPYAQKAWKTTKPYYKKAHKQGTRAYKKHVEPARKKALKKTKQFLDPHLKVARGHYNQKVQPHIDTVQDALKPYQKMYMRDVAPYLSQAYAYSLSAGSTSYVFYVQQVHPRVVWSVQQTHAFYVNNADPAMRRAYSVYIRPQADKLMAKIFARKAHAIEEEILKETKEHVREARQDVKSSSSSSAAVHTSKPGPTSTGLAASVQRAASTASKALPKVQHHVPDTLLGGGGGGGGHDDDMTPEQAAEIDKKAQDELSSVKKQLEAWETGMTQLVNKEYKLFTERIAEMRDSRMIDLPDHFDGLMSTANDQVVSIVEKIAQQYEKLGADVSDAEDRTAQLAKLVDQPLKKLRQARAAADEAINSYAMDLARDEAKTRDASVGEIRSFLREAVESYGKIMDDASFERTVEDFDGWDKGMIKRARLFATELDDLRRGNGTLRSGLGAVDLRKETSNLAPHFTALRGQVDTLFSEAFDRVESYSKASPLEEVASAVASIRKQALDLSEQAVGSMGNAVGSARARLGMAADTAQATSKQATKAASEAIAAAGEAVSGDSSDPATPPSEPEAIPEVDSQPETDTKDPVMRIQPVDMPGDGVDAEGNVVEAGRVASEQFGATGSGEGRNTVVDAPVEAEAEAEAEAGAESKAETPIDNEQAAEAVPVPADAPVAESSPDKIVADDPAEPEPVFSIQPVDMPGDGVDAEGQRVESATPTATNPASHEEL